MNSGPRPPLNRRSGQSVTKPRSVAYIASGGPHAHESRLLRGKRGKAGNLKKEYYYGN